MFIPLMSAFAKVSVIPVLTAAESAILSLSAISFIHLIIIYNKSVLSVR